MDCLTLPRPLAERLLLEARKTPHVEVCGFVGSRDNGACSVYPVANVADHPARRFLMAPAEQIAAIKAMRERREHMLAIYHSHPDMPPEPSVRDIDGLGYPDALLLIISLGSVPELRAWQYHEDRIREVPLETR